jgi:hypothetical protein
MSKSTFTEGPSQKDKQGKKERNKQQKIVIARNNYIIKIMFLPRSKSLL